MRKHLFIRVMGVVQGVGFRPFVYKLANELLLNGTVQNTGAGVLIDISGEEKSVREFISRLYSERPLNAKLKKVDIEELQNVGNGSTIYPIFRIIESSYAGDIKAQILPDIAMCDECLNEMFDKNNRRYLYPFINCINCGPRFSIIEAIPYDRCNTSMKYFEMCDKCRQEYENPYDRRFHAQPIACPVCGPQIKLWDSGGENIYSSHEAIIRTVELIRDGKIVALKGLGGFQLLADARNDNAAAVLRLRKKRDEKPFALMFPDLSSVRKVCSVSEAEEKKLVSVQSPIVLLKKIISNNPNVSSLIAPDNPYLGVMLPYTPLHHLIMKEAGFPIIATSGNISDEPMCIDEFDALSRLSGIADFFLVHNRPIVRYIDDSVIRVYRHKEMIIRRARGYAPIPIKINYEGGDDKVIMSVGGHLKNTIALRLNDQIFISQHIGDLSNKEALNGFNYIIRDFQRLYNIKPDRIISDLHPDYISTRIARDMSSEVISIQHHIAHIQSCRIENQVQGSALGIAWDGTGYGFDGTMWGSEFFICDEYNFTHMAQFRSFRLPGSEAAVKDCRRSALGILYEIFGRCDLKRKGLKFLDSFTKDELSILNQMLSNNINCPLTCSAGRLFDAVAAITYTSLNSSYEGQSAMMVEFTTDTETVDNYKFNISKNEIYIIDWEPIIEGIINDIQEELTIPVICGKFHNTLAKIIQVLAHIIGEKQVILSGGCFQNIVLLEKTIKRLEANDFEVYFHHMVPANDGGLSLGQAGMT